MNALSLEHVYFSYEDIFKLTNCCLTIQSGSFSVLLGPNGAGKTSLFHLVSGLLKPQQGSITLFGKKLDELSSLDIARNVAVVEQDAAYVFPFTVEEIVLMGRFPHAPSHFFESAIDERVAKWAMAITNTTALRRRSILELSGGERRRVEIARSLAQEARLLLLDEPTTYFDIKQQREFFRLVRRLNEEKGITVFLITHHIHLAYEFGKEFYFIKDGITRTLERNELSNDTEHLEYLFS